MAADPTRDRLDDLMRDSTTQHIETLSEMFQVAANERRMKEADAISAAIDALRAEAGAVGSAEIEAGAEAAWSMTPRGVPWGDASDHIQNEWRRIAKTILTAALAQARRTDRA